MEIWKDIRGYEGIYQISNHGRVKSIDRRVRNHKCGATRTIKEHIIHSTDNGNGYQIVGLRGNGKRKNFYVHRLVAEHFIEKPDGKEYINHMDYNRANNNVANLEWCTQKENMVYSIDRLKKPKPNAKLSNTGERYITKTLTRRKKNIRYRVNISQFGVDRSFLTMEDAIKYRNEVMNKWQNQYFKKTETAVSCAV